MKREGTYYGEKMPTCLHERWERVDSVLFFWKYYNLIYKIGVSNTCGDRMGSFLAG